MRGTCGFNNYTITLNSENLKGPESSKVREKCRRLTRIALPFSTHYPFSFRILTADDGLSQISCLKKKAVYGYEVQARENDRQRRYGKVWDTVLSDYVKG